MSGLGLAQMSSLLASQSAMKTMANLDASTTKLKGEMRTLASTIEKKKGWGMDTKADEERFASLQSNINGVMKRIYDSANKVNDSIVAESEKTHEEDGDESAEASGIMSRDGPMGHGRPDSVEISAVGRRFAASAPKPVHARPTAAPALTGRVLNATA